MPSYAGEVYEPIKKGSYELALVQPYTSKTQNFWFFPQLPDFVHEFKPDVIFCMQEPNTYCAYHAMTVAKLFNIPFVFFTWENIRKSYPSPWRAMESNVIKEADVAVGGNNDAMMILMEKGAKEAVLLPQTGIDSSLFVPSPPSGNSNKKKILFVGRLVKEKGILTILDAFDRLDDSFELKIVGGRGDLEPKIVSHPEFGKRITIENWIDYERMPQIYNAADIVVAPSIDTNMWREQMLYTAGEALLCFKPIITTASKSISEIWGSAPGVSFMNQNDTDSLITLLTSEKTYSNAKNGRKWVEENYSIEKVGNDYIELLELIA